MPYDHWDIEMGGVSHGPDYARYGMQGYEWPEYGAWMSSKFRAFRRAYRAAKSLGYGISAGAAAAGAAGIGYVYDSTFNSDMSNRKRRYSETNYQTLEQPYTKRLRGSPPTEEMPGVVSGVPDVDGAVNLLPDFDAEDPDTQFNSDPMSRVVSRLEEQDIKKRTVVSLGYPSIPKGFGRMMDRREFLPCVTDIVSARDFQIGASSKKWNIDSMGSAGSIFNDFEMVTRAYAQSIAANGHTAYQDPDDSAGHTGTNQDLLNNAFKTGKFSVWVSSNTAPGNTNTYSMRNPGWAASAGDTTGAPTDLSYIGSVMFNQTAGANRSMHCRFYLEKYHTTYRIVNAGNSKVTVKFLVVTPRKVFQKEAWSEGSVTLPKNMEWATYMDDLDTRSEERVAMYNNTSAQDTVDYSNYISGDSIVPFGAPSATGVWYSGLTEAVPEWLDFSQSIYKHKEANRFYKVREVRFTLAPGVSKDVTVVVPPQIVDLSAAFENYLPHLNYRCYMIARGELANGTAADDIGYSAGVVTTRTHMKYQVRYCPPPKGEPMKWMLRKGDITGNGEIWNDIKGAEENAETAA